jgi:hypothetical protein
VGKLLDARTAEREREWAKIWREMAVADAAARPGALCGVLRLLVRWTNAARTEVGNERLRRLAPAIAARGVAYERERFDAALSAGEIGLTGTRAWLRGSLEAADMTTLVGVAAGRWEDVSGLVAGAIARLAAGAPAGALQVSLPPSTAGRADSEAYPETLALDRERMRRLAAEARRLVRVGIAILAARSALAGAGGGGHRWSGPMGEAAMGGVTSALLALKATELAAPAAAADAAAAAVAFAESGPISGNAAECTQALGPGVGAGAAADTVRKAVVQWLTAPPGSVEALLHGRVMDRWADVASGAGTGAPAIAAAAGGGGARAMGLGAGLDALGPAVERAAALVARVAAVNLAVHGERYRELLQEEVQALRCLRQRVEPRCQ